jgi:DMSO/TMAO reductase YedYZ molybdopterin-dependent catalytic subunit
LKIEGAVARPIELSFADLIEAPAHNIEAVLECAGNVAGGSAASNAAWEGVSMSYLLKEAGAAAGAASVLLEGADSGRLLPDSPQLPYCQVVPIGKCMRPESMIALKLNGLFLPRRSGFPARALFPGWYAMDSVKMASAHRRAEELRSGFGFSGQRHEQGLQPHRQTRCR